MDPVRFARRERDPRDKEAVAFLAAALAFGNVKAIGRSVERLLAALGPRPARGAIEVARGARRLPDGLYHRWLKAPEIRALVEALGRAFEGWGSLEACFAEGFDEKSADVGPALDAFADRLFGAWGEWRAANGEAELAVRLSPSALPRRMWPAPRHRSACKRPCLFLRWVARPDDGIDLGIWRSVPPARLVAPVDVHVARVARRLGILRRRTLGWRAALEVTRGLRRVDPEDPLRFDFAMVYADRKGELL
jgi:uncharacterized protein (TIGR02757 family)